MKEQGGMMGKILGINERWYLKAYDLLERVPITVVLVQGDIGDYAAYIGNGSKEEAEWISHYGDKISFEEACIHFPGGQLKRELYRD